MVPVGFMGMSAFIDEFEHLFEKFHIDGNYNLLTSTLGIEAIPIAIPLYQ